ncbi:hypothetical protein ACWV95_02900 [Streptomyces albus]
MPGVGVHRGDERVLLVPVEEDHLDGPVTAQLCGLQPVHPVEYPHGSAVHEYGREGDR